MGQLAIEKDTIRKKHWQENWRIGTFKKWFTQIRALFGMINQMNTKKRQTSRDRAARDKLIQSCRIQQES
jgi:hypothetical protein